MLPHAVREHPEPRLLLASQSPRRRQLLAESGLRFEVVDSGVDDGQLGQPGPGVSAAAWVTSLAYLKAAAARDRLRRLGGPASLAGATILGADTVVACDDRLIGKPRDAEDARAIIERLENRDHDVLTGVALLGGGARRLFADRATVHVGVIGAERVRAYIESGRWRGKAGAYNLEEQVAVGWPIHWHGDPGTVMGLPMRRLRPMLEAFATAPAAGGAS